MSEAGALRILFGLAGRAPWLLRVLRPVAVRVAVLMSPTIRRGTAANAARLIDGPPPRCFARDVVGSFYDFVADLGAAQQMTAAELAAQAVIVEGHDAYVALRGKGGGAVLITAHMGSFEVGLAALRGVEREVHVVFKRDAFDGFEAIRRRVRRTLGVHEAAIDDGLPVLMKLRDALRAGAVVVLQADRAMPGQKSVVVPFAGGHLRLPWGPLKLAQAAGCPVVPVFTVREGPGRVRVCIEGPIDPAADDAHLRVAAAIERFVTKHPTQWLVLRPAFVEDADGG